jgi:MFS superfamily sulfate permease-like transporter
MAYALLARLTPAFGLYTTFTGACIYWVFGTSKDIVIGVGFPNPTNRTTDPNRTDLFRQPLLDHCLLAV